MTTEQMRTILTQAFKVARIDILDESHKHAKHKGAIQTGGGHYYVMLVSDDFENKSYLERHRMVYQALSPIKEKIHALGIQAYTVDEYENSGA